MWENKAIANQPIIQPEAQSAVSYKEDVMIHSFKNLIDWSNYYTCM